MFCWLRWRRVVLHAGRLRHWPWHWLTFCYSYSRVIFHRTKGGSELFGRFFRMCVVLVVDDAEPACSGL